MFAIEMLSPDASGNTVVSPTEAAGRIVIGDFTETFKVPLGFWSVVEYRRSWRQAFDVLKGAPQSSACFMTSMTDPEISSFLTCWPVYRDGKDVYVQNAIIFLDHLDASFDIGEPWASIQPRRIFDEDGNKVSEWITSMSDLRSFFE